jgi:hypothetical protein
MERTRHGGRGNRAGFHRLLFAVLLCGSTTGNANEAVPAAATVPDSAVLLVGPIDAAMVEQFNKAVRQRNVSTVVIASAGGGEKESLQIATAMQARNMDVVVREACASTCAHLIFVAGRKRRIEDGAVVMFRSSAAGMLDLFDAVGENVPRDFQPDAEWREYAEQERRLYEKAGVSTSLLMDAQLAQQPRCLVFNRRKGKPAGTTLSITYALWVPTRRQMEAAGISFEGFWPDSRSELLRVGTRYMQSKDRPGSERLLRFGDDDHLWQRGEQKYAPKQLQACAMEEEK